MSERRKTTLKGHSLVNEGKPYAFSDEGNWLRCDGTAGRGLCSCGKPSPIFTSDAARKRWHRDHKDQVRGGSDGG